MRRVQPLGGVRSAGFSHFGCKLIRLQPCGFRAQRLPDDSLMLLSRVATAAFRKKYTEPLHLSERESTCTPTYILNLAMNVQQSLRAVLLV